MKTDIIQNVLVVVVIAFASLGFSGGCLLNFPNLDQSHSVGGSVTGLRGTLVLQNANGETLALSSDGAFRFLISMKLGEAYAVTIVSQPGEVVCTLFGGSGYVIDEDITDITAVCSDVAYAVGGIVGGLEGTVVLQNNGGDDLSISSDGAFSFATPLVDDSPFEVSVARQPDGQLCTIADGSGTIAGAGITTVVVTCASDAYLVGGVASGVGGTVVLRINGGEEDLALSSDGAFSFPTPLADGSPYAVTIVSDPEGSRCTVENGSGVVDGADVTGISVVCATDDSVVGDVNLGLFVTASVFKGDLGGPAGADEFCMADSNYPGAGTYKALIAGGGRVACTSANCGQGGASEHSDWVLAADTTYARIDGTVIGRTNDAGIFEFPLVDAFSPSVTRAWTGITTSWKTAASRCWDWTSASAARYGLRGNPTSVSSSALQEATSSCNMTRALVCVEQ